ncbi:hypothetical protein SAY86_028584 [Trapa natans]|uniref:GDSL esterase/lipase n=1 Tax=Trapa natans TaxID=22666 RepID=A0AAN7LV73_TRANT|nr:hypothetical protein SAY86_028584 [Trapa natans]
MPIPFPLFLFFSLTFGPAPADPPLAAIQSPSRPGHSPTSLTPAPSSDPPISTPLVPALFILGDSSVDSGTNNFLGTFARADHPPYGRDFDTHRPTGRFCNGRIPVDYLALKLGLPFVPSYLGQIGSVEAMIHGVNFASAASGIIFSSGSELGQHVSFSQQIQQFIDTVQHFILHMGEDSTKEIISRSVVYISIGVNDYIHYYFQNESGVQKLFLPWRFAQFLVANVRQEIENLHSVFVRRVVVMGLAPIGCAPHYLWEYNSKEGECIEEINDQVMEFNLVMRQMVWNLNRDLFHGNVIFCDVFEGSMDIMKNHEQYGLDIISEACCGLGRYKGWIMCLSPEMACDDASNHVWWDQFHPTDAVNAILAGNVWNGSHTNMCYPMNLEKLVT